MADPGRIEPFSFAGSSDIDHLVSIRMYVSYPPCKSYLDVADTDAIETE